MVGYVGLGSNLNNRLNNLETAVKKLVQKGFTVLKTSSVYETPALLPPKAKADWNRPFLNAVVKISVPNISGSNVGPQELLATLKTIEKEMGRPSAREKWSPRVIDLDILLLDDKLVNTVTLTVPHPEIVNRNFVLTPLKEISPLIKIPTVGSAAESIVGSTAESIVGSTVGNMVGKNALTCFREHPHPLPTWMAIFNTTPDSFSDGGELNLDRFAEDLKKIQNHFISIVDLGAESTRPGALPVSPTEEWERLKPYMEQFFNFYKDQVFRPKLSVDTRHPQTAEKAIERGADIINDVSGQLWKTSDLFSAPNVDYVLTHSVTVPVDRTQTLPLDKDPVEEIKKEMESTINNMEKRNISLERVILDPGIGFGKTAEQSLEILKRVKEFYCFPLRIMIGHSKKSFMNMFSSASFAEREFESLGVSLSLIEKGVDILRVHQADLHVRATKGFFALKENN